MIITEHAKQRLRERCGFNKKSYERMVRKAYEDGISHKQTKGRLNKWITSLYFNGQNANNIRVYGDIAYIFCNKTLVTVIPVPADLRKDIKNMIKE